MNVTTIEMDAEEAQAKYKEYLEGAKKQKSKEYSAARRAYRALAKGFKVIDIYKAFEKTGLKNDGTPKLAIVRADCKQVYFTKQAGGAGRFSRHLPNNWRKHEVSSNILLPVGTFGSTWTVIDPQKTDAAWNNIKEPEITTNVPFIPAHISVPGKMENYYILFEVAQWKATASVKDPYLLQRLNDNTFIVLAEWDVSPVEAIIMRST